jgi:predicted glycoside hydrolase/deacetylase ChbG (UPF0249 family)
MRTAAMIALPPLFLALLIICLGSVGRQDAGQRSILIRTTLQMKKLVFCADDFALHGAASEGIASLAHQGCLTATSVMVLSPRWPTDVTLLESLRGHIDVGLHLDWTSEFALKAGHGMGLPRTMLWAWLRQIKPAQAKPVIERQLDEFEQVWQAPPDHVDGHQHVQQFPGIRKALVQVLAKRYGNATAHDAAVRPYLRISKLPPAQADVKARIIAAMGAEPLRRLARQNGVPSAPALTGVYNFSDSPRSYARHMSDWLHTSPEGTLLMCHPAHGVDAHDSIGQARVREYSHLSGAEFQAQLESRVIQLVRGSSLYQA